jgi:hypothetical protein
LNSAQLPSSSSPIISSDWEAVRRLHRRICVLRATGRDADASVLERGDFSRALSAARATSDSPVNETSLLAAESDRVADACVLADVLAPLLAEQLRPGAPASLAAVSPEAASTAVSTPTPSTRPSRVPVPGIADLIDGMLSQERAFPPAHLHS